MNETVFALLLMGCTQSMDVCREIDPNLPTFKTYAACTEGMQLASRMIGSFPVAVGECVEITTSEADAIESAQWFFAADGSLHLKIDSVGAEQQADATPEMATVLENS